MELINNIDIVQINTKQGTDEYYFPKNVNWRERKIDKILLALPDTTLLSPIDGQTNVLTKSQVSNLYFDLFSADDHQIARNLAYTNILSDNNHPLRIGECLSLNLSRLYFTTTDIPTGCLLLYIYYGTKESDEIPTTKSITVKVDLAANGRLSLQDIVDNYIHIQPNKVKGVMVWDRQNPCYLTLRNQRNDRVLNNVLSTLCAPPLQGTDASNTQAFPFRLDNIDIDMLNSFVQNATDSDIVQTITFNY